MENNDISINISIRTPTSERKFESNQSNFLNENNFTIENNHIISSFEHFPITERVNFNSNNSFMDFFDNTEDVFSAIFTTTSLPANRRTRRNRYPENNAFLELLRRSFFEDSKELTRNDNIKLELKKVKNESDKNEQCVICTNNMLQGEDVSSLECEHNFHHNCIFEWGKYKQSCPVCRTEIKHKK